MSHIAGIKKKTVLPDGARVVCLCGGIGGKLGVFVVAYEIHLGLTYDAYLLNLVKNESQLFFKPWSFQGKDREIAQREHTGDGGCTRCYESFRPERGFFAAHLEGEV